MHQLKLSVLVVAVMFATSALIFVIQLARHALRARTEREMQALTSDIHQYSLIHKRGSSCPVGWELVPGMFIRRDGTRCDGCARPGADVNNLTFDYLMSGESIRLGLQVVPPPYVVRPKNSNLEN